MALGKTMTTPQASEMHALIFFNPIMKLSLARCRSLVRELTGHANVRREAAGVQGVLDVGYLRLCKCVRAEHSGEPLPS